MDRTPRLFEVVKESSRRPTRHAPLRCCRRDGHIVLLRHAHVMFTRLPDRHFWFSGRGCQQQERGESKGGGGRCAWEKFGKREIMKRVVTQTCFHRRSAKFSKRKQAIMVPRTWVPHDKHKRLTTGTRFRFFEGRFTEAGALLHFLRSDFRRCAAHFAPLPSVSAVITTDDFLVSYSGHVPCRLWR